MAKRFTDTEKWKKPFLRGMKAPYKLLWLYILDECDHAGIWQIDIEVAKIKIGERIDLETAINQFGDRVIVFEDKMFIPDFVEFQYGVLNPENRAHKSVIDILSRHDLLDESYEIKPLTSPLQGAMDKDKELDKDKEAEIQRKNYLSEQFEIFWNYYNKGSKVKTRERFMKLTLDEFEQIKKHLKLYFAANPEKKFRKDAERYISHKLWETEIQQATLPEGWWNMDLTPEQFLLVPEHKRQEKRNHDLRRQMGI